MRSIADLLQKRGLGPVGTQRSIADEAKKRNLQPVPPASIEGQEAKSLIHKAQDFFQGPLAMQQRKESIRLRFSEWDEAVYMAITPGELYTLGCVPFDYASLWMVPAAVQTIPVAILTLTIDDLNTLVLADWKNFAHKNLGGNLVSMTTGEVMNSTLEIELVANTPTGVIQRISTITGDSTDALNGCLILDRDYRFIWPGRFCHIIHGPATVQVTGRYVAPPAAPFVLPTSWTTMLCGYWARG